MLLVSKHQHRSRAMPAIPALEEPLWQAVRVVLERCKYSGALVKEDPEGVRTFLGIV